jgi:hypothetical protein
MKMLKGLFSILDLKTKIYAPPMACNTAGEAERTFMNMIQEERYGNLSKYPEDFGLYRIADWDNIKGVVEPLAQKELVMEGQYAKELLSNNQ